MLRAAIALFAGKVFRDVSLADVATRAGVDVRTAALCFSDTRDLFDTLIEDALTPLRHDVLAALAQPAPLTERLRAAANVWVDHVARRPVLVPLLLQSRHGLVEIRGDVVPYAMAMMSEASDTIRREPLGPGMADDEAATIVSLAAGAVVACLPKEALQVEPSASPEQFEKYRNRLVDAISGDLLSRR